MSIPEVYQVSEAREGMIAYSMWSTGDFVLPYRYGALVPSKPPLFHWLSAAVIEFDPRYGEAGLRLPSAAAAGLLLLALGFFARRFAGVAAGWWCTVILVSTYGFVRLASDGR